MTEKLYDLDSYVSSFTATVLACEPDGKGACRVLLDRTAFFPEGGGQAPDRGTLGGASVTDVQIKNGDIWHTTDKPLPVGATVDGALDFDVRFRRMQNHSGEHIVSGLVHTLYGFDNVGFHLGSEDVTMDYSGFLDRDKLLRVEYLANEAVTKNVPITVRCPSDEELAGLDYRSKKELEGPVRIVTVEGYDVCACCAPHVSRTGEIGMIKLLDFAKYKGGVRVHMHCGFDALDDYNDKYDNVACIASSLSAKQSEAALAVERLSQELAAEKTAYHALAKRFAESLVAALPAGENLVFFDFDADADALRHAANLGKKRGGVFCALCGDDNNGYRYILASETVPLRTFFKEHIRLPGGGGGSDGMMQGAFRADRKTIEEVFRALPQA